GSDAAGRIREIAIQKLAAFEGGRLGDAVDGGENRVHLELIRGDLVGAETTAVGGLTDEALELGQQGADFVQATFGSSDHVTGKAGVADRRLNASLFLLQGLASDETCGVIGAGVDSQTCAEPLEAG